MGDREFEIVWSNIEFNYEDGYYVSELSKADMIYTYKVVIKIPEEKFSLHTRLEIAIPKKMSSLEKPKKKKKLKSYFKLSQSLSEYLNLSTRFKMPISNNYKKTSNLKDTFYFNFSATNIEKVKDKEQEYADAMKRIAKQDKNRNGYCKEPIKVYNGGSVSPK